MNDERRSTRVGTVEDDAICGLGVCERSDRFAVAPGNGTERLLSRGLDCAAWAASKPLLFALVEQRAETKMRISLRAAIESGE